MTEAILQIIIGIVVLTLGRSNMKGNISSVHWYHRKRVKEEDILPFGRMIGLGTVIAGVSIILLGVFDCAAEITNAEIFMVIGSVIAFIGIMSGVGLNFYAIFKYNKEIF